MTSRSKRSRSSPSSARSKPRSGSPSTERPPRQVPLAEIKDDFSRYLKLAAKDEIVITRHGKPAGVLIGFQTEDDWFEYRLEHHPGFLARIAAAREALRKGHGLRLEEVTT